MDDDAFDDFVLLHGTALTRLAFVICGDRGRAEDAAQVAFEKVYLKRRSLDDPLPYARRVAVNAARDSWRRHGRRESVGLSDQDIAALAPGTGIEVRDALFRALRRLPQKQRAVVVLRHWMDLSEQETADLLRISTGSVKSHNSRALAALRQSTGLASLGGQP